MSSRVGQWIYPRRALGKPTPRGENYQPCEQADRDATGGTAVLPGAAPLLRASWTSKRYLGYAGRTVRMEYRLTDGQDSAWANWFLDSAQTDDRGFVELFDLISAEEEGPGGVLPDDGPPCGGTIVFRGHYGGNGTSSGPWSTGDATADATIGWELCLPMGVQTGEDD